jgi:hypothetical protein
LNGRHRRHSGHYSALARNGSVANDPQRPLPARLRCNAAREGKAISMLDQLLDHLVGGSEQCLRYSEAERLGGLEVEDKIELGWLLHWNVSRRRPAQNLIDEIGSAAK